MARKLSDEISNAASDAKAGTLKVLGTVFEDWARRAAELETNRDTDRLISAERQRCAEKCQRIMRRHMEAESRKRTVEERSAEIAQALGAAECRGALSPYVVRDMSDEVARYPTFAEALVRYLDLREVIRSRANIVNEDECDGATDGNPDGLTEDERGQL